MPASLRRTAFGVWLRLHSTIATNEWADVRAHRISRARPDTTDGVTYQVFDRPGPHPPTKHCQPRSFKVV